MTIGCLLRVRVLVPGACIRDTADGIFAFDAEYELPGDPPEARTGIKQSLDFLKRNDREEQCLSDRTSSCSWPITFASTASPAMAASARRRRTWTP